MCYTAILVGNLQSNGHPGRQLRLLDFLLFVFLFFRLIDKDLTFFGKSSLATLALLLQLESTGSAILWVRGTRKLERQTKGLIRKWQNVMLHSTYQIVVSFKLHFKSRLFSCTNSRATNTLCITYLEEQV